MLQFRACFGGGAGDWYAPCAFGSPQQEPLEVLTFEVVQAQHVGDMIDNGWGSRRGVPALEPV